MACHYPCHHVAFSLRISLLGGVSGSSGPYQDTSSYNWIRRKLTNKDYCCWSFLGSTRSYSHLLLLHRIVLRWRTPPAARANHKHAFSCMASVAILTSHRGDAFCGWALPWAMDHGRLFYLYSTYVHTYVHMIHGHNIFVRFLVKVHVYLGCYLWFATHLSVLDIIRTYSLPPASNLCRLRRGLIAGNVINMASTFWIRLLYTHVAIPRRSYSPDPYSPPSKSS